MLKTHRKSLLALALVPALLAAQLTGITGALPAAHAALTFSVTATSTVAAGGTLDVTVSGASSGECIDITVNSPYGVVSANHYSTVNALVNGDTAEYGAGYGTGAISAGGAYPPVGYANVLQQVEPASSSGSLTDSNFTIPTTAVPGVYGVSAAGVSTSGASCTGTVVLNDSDDYGSTTFTVTSGNNDLLINGSSGTQSVSLGQEFNAFYSSYTAGATVSFYLQNFADVASGVPNTGTATTVSGLGQSTGTLNGTTAGTGTGAVGSVPLQIVSCGSSAAVTANDNCVLNAGSTALNATLMMATPNGNALPLLSSLFYDQVYSIVASSTTSSNTAFSLSAPTVVTAAASNTYPAVTLANATGGTFTLTVDGADTTGTIPFNASAGTVQDFLGALADVGVGNVTVTSNNGGGGTAEGGPYDVVFTGAASADTLTATATGLTNSATSVTIGSVSINPGVSANWPAVTLNNATAGTFTLTVTGPAGGPFTTGTIAYNAAASAVQTALNAVLPATAVASVSSSNAGGVTGVEGGPYDVTITGSNVPAGITMTADATLLTNSAPTVTPGNVVTAAGASTTYNLTVTAAGGTFTLSVTNAGSTDTTTAIAEGSSAATVQAALVALANVGANATVTGAGAVGSPYVIVFAGTADAATMTGSGAGLTGTVISGAPTVIAENGIKIDHTQSTVSVSSTLVGVGSSVSVSGYNWGAGSTVLFYFVDQLGGGGTGFSDCLSPGQSAPGVDLVGTSIPSADVSYQGDATVCFLGSTTAGGGPSTNTTPGGTFSGVSLTLPSSTSNNSYSGGKVLAIDLGPAGVTEASHRLNESAYASVLVSSIATSTGAFQLSTITPALDQTVTYTATGFLASSGSAPEYATLTGATICGLSSYPLGQVLIDTTGTAHGSFALPTGCSIAGGDSYTLTLTGTAASGSSESLTATITVPDTTITASTNGTTITFTGTGFEAGETVTLQLFSTVATGTAGSPLSVVTAGPDGTITGTAAAPGGLGTGFYYIEASGTSSGFTATANVGYSVGGNISTLPTLVPGETVTVTGTQFLAPPSGGSANILSINFSPTPVTGIPMTVDASGNMSATFTVPTGTTAGTYTLTATAYVPGVATQQQRFLTITVVTGKVVTLTASPTTVAIGGTTAVTGSGFAPSEVVTIALNYLSGGLADSAVPGTQATVNADATGAISTTYTVNSSVGALVPGSYVLTATGASTLSGSVNPFVVTATQIGGVSTSNVYFAEGYTGQTSGGAAANFAETISILNANNYTTTYTVTYFIEHTGASSTVPTPIAGTIGPDSVVERSVNTDVGNNVSVAAEVSAPAPLAATRIIARTTAAGASLNSSSSLGQQLNLSAPGPLSYYFASGDILGTTEEYLTILNPNSTTASITLNILPQTVVSSTSTPTVAPISLSVPANSRLTEPIRAALLNKGFTQFGITLSSNVPVAAERVEYYGNGIGSGKYGATTSPASSSTNLQYIFAEDTGTWPSTGGTSGTGADVSEVDIINPAPATTSGSATVTVFFLDASGNPINSQQVQVDPGTRESVSVNDVVQTQAGVFSTVVTSDRPIYVERPTYYGGDPTMGGTYATVNPAGAPAGLTEVAFPYLDLTNGTTTVTQTVYLYNPGTSTITVRGIYASGTKTVVKSYTVAANSITTVNVNTDAATLTGPIGGIFQIVQSFSGASQSFVAMALHSQSSYGVVSGEQGSYPIAATLGV